MRRPYALAVPRRCPDGGPNDPRKPTPPTRSGPLTAVGRTDFASAKAIVPAPTAHARDKAWAWLTTYPVRNHVWTQYFEDVLIYPDYRANLNQYSALETARYLLEHPEMDPAARTSAKD